MLDGTKFTKLVSMSLDKPLSPEELHVIELQVSNDKRSRRIRDVLVAVHRLFARHEIAGKSQMPPEAKNRVQTQIAEVLSHSNSTTATD